MSRPPKSEPRIKQLNLSLTARELASIETRAAALGMRAVHFSRAVLLKTNRTTKVARRRSPDVPKPEHNNFDRLIHAQLVRLGNNLNQMTRHLHSVGGPAPADLAPLLADIRAMIARVPR